MVAKFPSRAYQAIDDFFDGYQENIISAWRSLDKSSLIRAANLLVDCLARDGTVFACGNGGSAAIANHLLCDFHKGIQTGTSHRPRVVSLSSHLELITAVANDIGFEDIFVFQLRTMARAGDLLITISSSGDSENVVRAMHWAKSNGVPIIAMAGFSGGRSATIADVVIHVNSRNYGIIEDVHQSMMHLMAQYLRQASMGAEDIVRSTF